MALRWRLEAVAHLCHDEAHFRQFTSDRNRWPCLKTDIAQDKITRWRPVQTLEPNQTISWYTFFLAVRFQAKCWGTGFWSHEKRDKKDCGTNQLKDVNLSFPLLMLRGLVSHRGPQSRQLKTNTHSSHHPFKF